jgi:signal peptidase II
VRRVFDFERLTMRLAAKIAGLILLLDQISKYYVVHVLDLERKFEIEVIPGWFNLRMAWNQGMNFGLFAGEDQITRWILVVIALVISVWVWVWISRANQGPWVKASAGVLIGGALGNVIDRVWYGAVADFLNTSIPGITNPYSFNVADVAIFAGAIGLVILPTDAPKAGSKPRRKSAS